MEWRQISRIRNVNNYASRSVTTLYHRHFQTRQEKAKKIRWAIFSVGAFEAESAVIKYDYIWARPLPGWYPLVWSFHVNFHHQRCYVSISWEPRKFWHWFAYIRIHIVMHSTFPCAYAGTQANTGNHTKRWRLTDTDAATHCTCRHLGYWPKYANSC